MYPTVPVADYQDKLLFVCGLHRSGTSLLHRCIGDHPDVSAFADTGVPKDEGQHLQSVYLKEKGRGGLGEFAFHRGAHLTERSGLANEKNRDKNAQRLFSEWARFWDLDARRLVEKSPPNLIMSRFLQALFPDAAFIFLVRHPVAVSYATQTYTAKTTPAMRLRNLIEHWLAAHDLFRKDLPHIGNAYVLRYEDFVRTPEATLGALYGFAGLDPYPLQRDVRSNVNDAYLDRFERSGLARTAHRLYLQQRFESRVRAYGYSLRPGHYLLDAPPLYTRPS